MGRGQGRVEEKPSHVGAPATLRLAKKFPHLGPDQGWPDPNGDPQKEDLILGPFLIAQAEFWWDRHGVRYQISKMGLRHLIAMIPFLENKSAKWYEAYLIQFYPDFSDEVAKDKNGDVDYYYTILIAHSNTTALRVKKSLDRVSKISKKEALEYFWPDMDDQPQMEEWIKKTPLYRAIKTQRDHLFKEATKCRWCRTPSGLTTVSLKEKEDWRQFSEGDRWEIEPPQGWKKEGNLDDLLLYCPTCLEARKPKPGRGIKRVSQPEELLHGRRQLQRK